MSSCLSGDVSHSLEFPGSAHSQSQPSPPPSISPHPCGNLTAVLSLLKATSFQTAAHPGPPREVTGPAVCVCVNVGLEQMCSTFRLVEAVKRERSGGS